MRARRSCRSAATRTSTASGEPIYLIGVEFSKETRSVTGFPVERA